MKPATQDVGLIRNESNELEGISLGADYAAEHECGIADLCEKFSCDSKKLGLFSRRITKNAASKGMITIDNATWYYITSYEEIDPKSYVCDWPTVTCDDCKVKVGWDEHDFAVLCTQQKPIDFLFDLFDKKDAAFVRGSTGFLANAGLKIVRFTYLPKELLAESVSKEKSYDNAKERLEKSKAFKLLKKKEEEWRKKYPYSFHTPWSFMALSARADSEDYWLNPENQQHINYGWFSLQDIEDWANEKPGRIIPSKERFEDLKFELSMPLRHMYAIRGPNDSWGDKPFRRVSPLQWRPNDMPALAVGKKDKYLNMNTLPEDSIDAIEAYVKRIALDSMFVKIGCYDWSRTNDCNLRKKYFTKFIEDGPKEAIEPSKEAESEINGIFIALKVLNYGTWGACNVDEGIGLHNLSYWRDLVMEEVVYDFLLLCNLIPESRKYPDWKPIKGKGIVE